MKRLGLVIGLWGAFVSVFAQAPTSLEEYINVAVGNSMQAKVYQWNYDISKLNYRIDWASRMPGVRLSGSAPTYNRSITSILTPEGINDFVYQNYFAPIGSLTLSQPIGVTGGSVSVFTSFRRTDNFINDTTNFTNYNSVPFIVSLDQPLNGYNPIKWQKKIAKLNLKEAEKRYVENRERVAFQATERYFTALLAQVNLEITQKNFENSQELLKVSKGKFELGTIPENDLLQMEVTFLDAESEYKQAQLDHQQALFELRNFAGSGEVENLELQVPMKIRAMSLQPGEVVSKAKESHANYEQWLREEAQALNELASAKASRFDVRLQASYGNTGQGETWDESIAQLKENQAFNVSISIPLVDFGAAKSRRQIAETRLEIVRAENENELKLFENQLKNLALSIPLAYERVQNAAKADTAAKKRYEITYQRYLLGKIAVTELNNSMISKDNSYRNYIRSLFTYWQQYYTLRRLTLYDFERGESLSRSVTPTSD